ncbi:MAG: hypothetical protein IPJ16_08310 [Bacteroidales bacterium]|nr:hypothetical protein [Bacteroidales bacterium]
MELPDYKIQQRDILYITAKAMATDGRIQDFLSSFRYVAEARFRGRVEAIYMDMM